MKYEGYEAYRAEKRKRKYAWTSVGEAAGESGKDGATVSHWLARLSDELLGVG